MLKYLFLFICITTNVQAQIMLPAFQAVQYKNSGIVIPSVTIGTQNWMTKNLDVATYRDGTPIPQVTDPTAWANLTTGAWCYYNNDPANGLIYGKLYNWYAVNDPRGLAPVGWHIPSDAEWNKLSNFLGGSSVAGDFMKETGTLHWRSPNTAATNSSGFTALPAGFKDATTTGFFTINDNAFWWSTTELSVNGASYRYMNYTNGTLYPQGIDKKRGNSVRCIKD
jgi:uncharacterized protein (TIGR02145 family)